MENPDENKSPYTCNDYRAEMILLGLQKQLARPDITSEEKDELLPYSYIAERQQVDDQPLFQGVQGPSMVMDLSQGSDLFNAVDVLDQKDFFVFADNYATVT